MKNPLDSLTIRGLLVVVIGMLARYFELPVDPDGLTNDLVTVSGHLAEVVGLVMAAVGRWRATEPLKPLVPK